MLFQFLKYLQPTAYFTLKNKKGEYIYPDPKFLPNDILRCLEEDSLYRNVESRKMDLAYQAIQKGYIGNCKRLNTIPKIPLVDQYHFIRKHFSGFWVFYTFLIRLITFKNPILEFLGFFKTIRVSRINYHKNPIKYEGWKDFQSELIKSNPKVSVIIPTLNRYQYLKDVLEDLEKQDYENFEVIVVDQSEPFQKEFYNRFKLDIQLIHQEEKALWLARNRAIQKSTSDFFLLFDDDSRVDSNWITNHLKYLDFFKADISSGVSISLVGAKVPDNYSHFLYSEQLDTGNVLIKKAVFERIGLFDRQFEKQRMGDGEFGLRAYLEGFTNISNPYAKRLHLKVGTGGLRQMGSWDGFRPKNWFAPRPIPSVLYLYRKYYGTKKTIFSLFRSIPPSTFSYKFKGTRKIIILGYLSMMLIWPLVLCQVVKSWKLATIKLKKGALIDNLGN